MPARARHVLHVRLPGQSRGRELIGDRLDGSGIDTALAEVLAIGRGDGGTETSVEEAVRLRCDVRTLSAHHRDVVVEARMADRVVLAEELALLREGLRQVRRRRPGPEGRVEALVFQDDDENVAD